MAIITLQCSDSDVSNDFHIRILLHCQLFGNIIYMVVYSYLAKDIKCLCHWFMCLPQGTFIMVLAYILSMENISCKQYANLRILCSLYS